MSFRRFGSAIKKAELIATVQLRLRLSVPAHHFFMAATMHRDFSQRLQSSSAIQIRPLDQGHVSTVGKAVVLTDGEAGTVDEVHGLQISIRGHYGKWPISTIKFAEGH